MPRPALKSPEFKLPAVYESQFGYLACVALIHSGRTGIAIGAKKRAVRNNPTIKRVRESAKPKI